MSNQDWGLKSTRKTLSSQVSKSCYKIGNFHDDFTINHQNPRVKIKGIVI